MVVNYYTAEAAMANIKHFWGKLPDIYSFNKLTSIFILFSSPRSLISGISDCVRLCSSIGFRVTVATFQNINHILISLLYLFYRQSKLINSSHHCRTLQKTLGSICVGVVLLFAKLYYLQSYIHIFYFLPYNRP